MNISLRFILSKSIRSLFLFCLIFFTVQSQATDKKKKQVYYSHQQMENEDEWTNFDHYPIPNMSDSEVFSFLKKRIEYPAIAKRNFLAHEVLLEVIVDTSGKFSAINLLSNPVPIFDSTAIRLIHSMNGYWKAGRSGNTKKSYELTIPIDFNYEYRDDKVFFTVDMFYNLDSIIVDSTNTFPAFLKAYDTYETKNKDSATKFYYKLNQVHMQFRDYWDINRDYGKVEMGVEIDTNGKAVTSQIMTSFSPALDSEAYNELKQFDWIPAHKQGQKVPSFKYFYMVFEKRYKLDEMFQIDYYNYEFMYVPRAMYDFHNAEKQFKTGDYKFALINFSKAANWYNKNAEIVYDKALTEVKLNKIDDACADFQKCYELAEQYGYPLGLLKENLEAILHDNCNR